MAFLAMLACGSVAAEPPSVRAIRFGEHPDKTRVVIEVSAPVSASVFGLTDPLRLVIDLPELDWQVPQSQGGNGVGMVESFRSGLFRPGNTRVVLVLARPVDVAAEFLLPPSDDFGWRWVVDLVPADAKAFAALVQPPTAGKARPKRKPLDLLAQAAGDSRPMVVIDPGHGGNDPGAVGVGGSVEKDLVLAYAEELKLILLDSGRYRVALTRDDDTYLPLRGRTGVARSQDAALFISLHVNTDPSEHTRGFSVYTLSEKSSDAEAAALAVKENKSDIIAGVDLDQYSKEVANILIDFAQAKTNQLSVTFARDDMLPEVARDVPLLARPWRAAGFAVLKLPDVPSVLVELGYVSNREEERTLSRPDHRHTLSTALARAIDRYFTGTRQARRP